MSSRSIRSSSSMSPDQSTISVRRGTANGSLHLAQLVRDDRHDPLARAQDVEVVLDLAGQLFQLVGDFLARPARSGAAGADRGWRGPGSRTGCRCRPRSSCGSDRRSAGCSAAMSCGRPAPGHQLFARLGRHRPRRGWWRTTSSTLRHGDGQTAQEWLRSRALRSSIGRAPRHNFLAEGDEMA